MIAKFFSLIFLLFLIFSLPINVLAKTPSYVSIINPVRGNDFWDTKDQTPDTVVSGQINILKNKKVPVTWLLRFDVLDNKQVLDSINNSNLTQELGIFLEITPSLTKEAEVTYHISESWHSAGSAFLSGYEIGEREILIDAAFSKFKRIFGFYPKTVGAWWVDAHSLSYMQKKYDIDASLIVADQYTTDNYQIWGQYWSTPYYPSSTNALHPASSIDTKIPVVIVQWAARDPVNAYGNGVEESTYSVQANDYVDYHNLSTDYFSNLVDIFTNQKFNQFNFLVVGLENSYDWKKYSKEYENQINVLKEKEIRGQLSIITAAEFTSWYKKTFIGISPSQIIVSEDPLNSFRKSVWFMNPYYRVGWFINNDGSVFRDVRQYVAGEEELCFRVRCDSVNFASFATRVLDEVSFGQKLIVDAGQISDFNIKRTGENYGITYKNAAGKLRIIEFLSRDIKIDNKISSIDGFILDATKHQLAQQKIEIPIPVGLPKFNLVNLFIDLIKFLLFIALVCLIPGFLLINKIFDEEKSFWKIFALSSTLGFVISTLLFYLVSILKIRQAIFIYIVLCLIFFIKRYKNMLPSLIKSLNQRINLPILGVIAAGTIFQQLAVFKSGLVFPFGIGFWGPNTHDGIWHISLINQLVKGVPVENPVFAGEILKNYHFMYDLLIALTNYITKVNAVDLVFRFYPTLFSLFLGILSYYFLQSLSPIIPAFKNKTASFFSLYLIYFAGSFGWIVDLIRGKGWGGESNFWANQAGSFNLNPPFAISLIILISILCLLQAKKINKFSVFSLVILSGSLIAFKAYAGVLVIIAFLITAILKRSFKYLVITFFSSALSLFLFLSNFSLGKQLMVFSPFWFIHSMVDSGDRVGWTRLTLARVAGIEQNNSFKFYGAEFISLLLFIIGNLGTRFFSLFYIVKIKKIFSSEILLFLFILSSNALFIPIFFIQAGNPWNTIQFLYYFLYVSALFSGIFFEYILKIKPRIIPVVFILVIFLITPVNSWSSAKGYLTYNPHAMITPFELTGLNFLKNKKDGIVLTFPFDLKLKQRISEPWPLYAYDSTAYVAAFSEKAVFLEDLSQNQILLTDYEKRQVAAKDFFVSSSTQQVEFLRKNNIRYIYIPKIFNQRLEESNGLKNIFENEEIVIYELNIR